MERFFAALTEDRLRRGVAADARRHPLPHQEGLRTDFRLSAIANDSLPPVADPDNCLDNYRSDDYDSGMTTRAATKRPPRFDSPEQEAFLSLWRTYDRLRALEDELFATFELTPQQYNALRVLRSAAPDPVPTLVVAERLVSRAPDITRMLDKLELRGLVRRDRSATDRRTVLVAVTDAGMRLVEDIAQPLRECHARQLGHLPPADLKKLVALLKAARAPHEPDDSPWA